MAVRILTLRELVHKLARSGLITGRMKDIGCQCNDISVFSGTRGSLDGGDFFVETFLSGLDQSPHDVSVRCIRWSAAEGVDGFGVPVEAPVSIAAGKQPRSGAIAHILVHGAS